MTGVTAVTSSKGGVPYVNTTRLDRIVLATDRNDLPRSMARTGKRAAVKREAFLVVINGNSPDSCHMGPYEVA